MLRYDLRAPFCAWLNRGAAAAAALDDGTAGPVTAASHAAREGVRRCEIADVHRQPAGAGPRSVHRQADIDIAGPALPEGCLDYVVADAEVIHAAHAAVARLPDGARSALHVRVSHTALLAAALRHVGVDAQHTPAFLQEINRLLMQHATPAARERAWPAACRALRAQGLPKAAFGRCKPLVLQGPEHAAPALEWLAAAVPTPATKSPHVQRAFDECRLLLEHLSTWGFAVDAPTEDASKASAAATDVTTSVSMDPFMLPPTAHHKGLTFQLFWRLPPAATSTSFATAATAPPLALVAHGGRYDALLRALVPTANREDTPTLQGTGATLNVDRIADLASRLRAARTAPAGGAAAPARRLLSAADVLVAARGGGGMLRERMAVLRTLWDAGIAAETVQRSAPSSQDQYHYARLRGVRALVLLLPEQYERNQAVTVRAYSRIADAKPQMRDEACGHAGVPCLFAAGSSDRTAMCR